MRVSLHRSKVKILYIDLTNPEFPAIQLTQGQSNIPQKQLKLKGQVSPSL